MKILPMMLYFASQNFKKMQSWLVLVEHNGHAFKLILLCLHILNWGGAVMIYRPLHLILSPQAFLVRSLVKLQDQAHVCVSDCVSLILCQRDIETYLKIPCFVE